MTTLDYLVAGGLGLALAACSGFRVFVPLLAANLAYLTGFMAPSAGFEWLGSWAAFGVLATATVAEMLAYYVPVIDNALDTITTPASFIAGTLLMTSALPNLDPMVRWGLGILVGGGTAGMVQSGTALLRAGSTATTAGFGNPILATLENFLAIAGSVLGLLLPLVMAGLVVVLLLYLAGRFRRLFFRRSTPPTNP
ncbi:DUF4126 domain-containing protein [Hymenobacter chitinivorans]|uniref:Uncharacterized protein DUF4126 n=1 Tax=Hymenobacter chitinivorans DSM 11115 TaxID=1121954 RepID=A0A2M9BT60_9BACT|nr:DUF4126 domain-containing protein [Hymenobacter chitinivorans]PJJ61138.1 uncharacterized protein DUF4126 [Hymenobacter chitinivorans DSM 11115]